MATCETCGAVYPTNGLRGAIHEPSACRALAVRVAELTRERDESLSGALDETRAQLAEEQTAHATLRALWDARCGTIASVQARLTEAEERLEAAERVVEAARALEFAVLLEAGARESMHAPRAVLSATLTHRADVLAALDADPRASAAPLPGPRCKRCDHQRTAHAGDSGPCDASMCSCLEFQGT